MLQLLQHVHSSNIKNPTQSCDEKQTNFGSEKKVTEKHLGY